MLDGLELAVSHAGDRAKGSISLSRELIAPANDSCRTREPPALRGHLPALVNGRFGATQMKSLFRCRATSRVAGAWRRGLARDSIGSEIGRVIRTASLACYGQRHSLQGCGDLLAQCFVCHRACHRDPTREQRQYSPGTWWVAAAKTGKEVFAKEKVV